MFGEKTMKALSLIRNVAVPLVCACTCLFAAAMLAASLAVISDWFGGMIGYAVVVMGVWCLVAYFSRAGILKSATGEMVVLVALCLIIQLFLIGLLPSLGQNGMAAAWDSRAALRAIQSGKICFMHKVLFPYWCNYEILLSALGIVFQPKIFVGQVLNALCCVSVIPPLYKISEKIGGRGIARFAALLVGMSPAIMLYSTMLTSEFLSAALLFYGFYFLCVALRHRDLRAAVLPAAIGGGLVGLSHLFKSITSLFLAAFAVVLLVAWLEQMRRSRAWRLCVVGGLVVVSSMATRMVGQTSLAAVAQEPRLVDACDQWSPLLCELVMGLNVATDGIFDGNLAMKYLKMDEPQRKRFAASVFKRDWRKYPKLMVRKFVNLHGSHMRPGGTVSSFTLTFRDWPLVKRGRNLTPAWVWPFTDCGTMLFRFVFLLGALGLLMSRRRGFEFCMPGFFAALFVLAFAAVEQLIEGHGRYKTAVYPFYFMIVPYAYVWLEKDNPLYVRVGGLIRRLWDRIKIRHER